MMENAYVELPIIAESARVQDTSYIMSTNPDTVGFTILSSKDSSLYYSNNWTYDANTLAWKTVLQPIAGTTPVVIG